MPEVTVGKHAASGPSSHPLVAEALAHRSGHGGAHRQDGARENEGPVGWPGPAPSPGGGIGWPADADQADEEPAPAGALGTAA
jgi:hypothetical protein